MNGHSQIVESLVPISDVFKQCNVSIVNKKLQLQPPLVVAAGLGHVSIVTTLLLHETKSNQPEEKIHAALAIAAKNGYLDVVKVLVANGADVKKSKAIQKANHKKHSDVVEFLKSAKANSNANNGQEQQCVDTKQSSSIPQG